jgi:hypothetical protein
MNMATEIRRRARGNSILWPLEPMLDESIRGYLARTADWNCFDSRTDLLRLVGLTYVRRDLSDRIAAEITATSGVLGIEGEALRRILNPTIGGNPEVVDYFGLPFQRRRFEFRDRRVSPASLRRSAHHRARWQIRLLPFCPESWEHLIDRCPSERCGKPLRWAGCLKVDRCEHCEFDLKLATPKNVPRHLRDTLSFVADLLHPAPEVRARAVARLPPPLDGVAESDVFEILHVVTRSFTPDYLLPTASEHFDITDLALGARVLLDYPATLDRVAKDGRRNADPSIMPLFARLKRRAKEKAGVQKAVLLSMVDRAEAVHYSPVRVAKMGEEHGEWTFHRSAVWLGISFSQFNAVVDAGLVHPSPRRGRIRQIRWIMPGEVHRLSVTLRRRMAPSEFVQSYDLPHAGMEQLISLGLIEPCTEPIVERLHPGLQLDRVSVLNFVSRVAEFLAPPLPDSVALEDVFHGIGGREKPWGAVINAALGGQVPGGLGLEPDGRLRFQRLTIPKQFARELLAGRYPEMLTLPPELQIWGGAPDFSRVEAQRYLNCFPRDLTWLLSEGHLSAGGGGQFVRRAKVVRLGRKLIGSREISWRWRVSPNEWEELADTHRIARCLGAFWPRAAVEKHFANADPLGSASTAPYARSASRSYMR